MYCITQNPQLKTDNTNSTCFIMAAPVKKMVGVSDDSSSSDDEALKRCQEAVWETRTDKGKGESWFFWFCLWCETKSAVMHGRQTPVEIRHYPEGDSNVKQSKRVIVADHDHDGNELQVSQGFRTHVAKKLGHLLDSYITEKQNTTSSCVESAKCGGCGDDDDNDDKGFRLFSTSVPGQTAEEPQAPVRRRPVPSSSDSDSEMETRLREAAVSVKDLLPSSSLSSTLSIPSTEPPCSGNIKKKKKVAEGEDSYVYKKKKKRKPYQEESAHVDCASSPLKAQSNGEPGNSEKEHMQVKVKQKKKKKREANKEEEALT
ncbi:protein CUSTOS isoform X1 [Xiphias gladius]|uniref:protein CUSTOS isoform X1 n=1 Tax=Xiphias gladius TaxID=8245 RepID=UPI001A9A0F92|nr:protein CUSTOS isoform X1 [Xiphias gladius]